MISETRITPLDAYLKSSARSVTAVMPYPFFEEKTGMAQDKTNVLLSESAGADQVYLVHDYQVIAPEGLQLTIYANNEAILSTTEKLHTFAEPILIEPQKSIEIKESHANRTIPIKIIVHNVRYNLTAGGGGVA